MSLYKSTDQAGQPLNVGYAEDVGQIIDVLSGTRDGGALSLLQPLSAPAAPATSLSAGGITGTGYQWAVYWITGILDGTGAAHVTGRTPYGTLTGAQALTAQQATVSIAGLGSPPTGAIGWGVARNKSGGATWYEVPNSEQFMSLAGTMPATFVDNTADASLVTTAPTTNTTGTTISGIPVPLKCGRFTSNVSTSGTSYGTGVAVLSSAVSFTADGVGRYGILISAQGWGNSTPGQANNISAQIDGAQGPTVVTVTQPANSPLYNVPLCQIGDVGVLSAGSHTLNAVLWCGGGTVTIGAGSGGAGNPQPVIVGVVKLT